MALTVVRDQDPLTKGQQHQIGDCLWSHGTITFDNSYPTGGEVVAASDFRFQSSLMELLLEQSGAEVAKWNKTTGKILLYTADGTEATNASDQSAVSVRYLAIGR